MAGEEAQLVLIAPSARGKVIALVENSVGDAGQARAKLLTRIAVGDVEHPTVVALTRGWRTWAGAALKTGVAVSLAESAIWLRNTCLAVADDGLARVTRPCAVRPSKTSGATLRRCGGERAVCIATEALALAPAAPCRRHTRAALRQRRACILATRVRAVGDRSRGVEPVVVGSETEDDPEHKHARQDHQQQSGSKHLQCTALSQSSSEQFEGLISIESDDEFHCVFSNGSGGGDQNSMTTVCNAFRRT